VYADDDDVTIALLANVFESERFDSSMWWRRRRRRRRSRVFIVR